MRVWSSCSSIEAFGGAQLVFGVAAAHDLGFLVGEQLAQLADVARDEHDALERAFVVEHGRAGDRDRNALAAAW